MIIEPKQTTAAFRCSGCGATVLSAVNMFSLSADMLKLKCDCKKSEMTVTKGNDGEIRLTVPCILCGKNHNYTVTDSLFFSKDLFAFPCPYTNMTVAAIGDANEVKAEMAKSELELLDLLEKNGIKPEQILQNGENEQTVTDPQIRDIVLFVIHDLDAEGKISCKCDKCDNGREYDADIQDSGILVTCKKCHAKRLIPTDSSLSAYAFLNADSLTLE